MTDECLVMYATASYVVETLTGQWLGDYLREKIWEPLGMKSTVCLIFGFLFRECFAFRMRSKCFVLMLGHSPGFLFERKFVLYLFGGS